MILIEEIIQPNWDWEDACNSQHRNAHIETPATLAAMICEYTSDEIIDPEGLEEVLNELYRKWQADQDPRAWKWNEYVS
jgi:hypothetical protein